MLVENMKYTKSQYKNLQFQIFAKKQKKSKKNLQFWYLQAPQRTDNFHEITSNFYRRLIWAVLKFLRNMFTYFKKDLQLLSAISIHCSTLVSLHNTLNLVELKGIKSIILKYN